jgi:hypothetical protein
MPNGSGNRIPTKWNPNKIPTYTEELEKVPTAGNNPSDTYTEVVVGTETTTTQQRIIGATTYQKVFVENSTTGVTTISSWVEV